MKVYLSAIETNHTQYLIDNVPNLNWVLMSYFYLRNRMEVLNPVLEHCKSLLIDSGAHSFQKGKKVDWLEYTKQYAQFIREHDNPKIIGYFEMDVDNIIGYDKVLELRKILESVTDKIIPVWHKNRGIPEFIKMCENYSGRWVAVTGFKNEDIRDEQYIQFVKTAKKYGCKLHCLGMTRKKILDKVPFDSVDSSSWKQHAIFGRVGDRKVAREFSRKNINAVMCASFQEAQKMQDYYHKKWIKYDK